ncbi:MAG: N-formylglutamate amidohydrolase [bacterium]|nr:N-formylglutamate amidohydrolase [bacterium]
MSDLRFSIVSEEGALVGVALHAGNRVRPNLLDHFALTEIERLYEEDPGTDLLAEIAPTRLISHISRFEHDLNRPREKAVYRHPDDAWGMTVWKTDLPDAAIAESLDHYDEFYRTAQAMLRHKVEKYGKALVLDLHSYNHRRSGPTMPAADSSGNPTIEIDTTETNRQRWSGQIDRLIECLRDQTWNGERLDVRENVRFRGPGHFAKWVEESFGGSICVVSIEAKKVYMDEWTGEIDQTSVESLRRVLKIGVEALSERIFGE